MAEKTAKENIEPPPENVGRMKENPSETSEPPPENGGHQKSKAEPSIWEWNPQGFAKIPRCWDTPSKKKQEWEEANRASLGSRKNVGASDLPTDPEDRQIEASTTDKNMNDCMTPDKS